MSEIYTTGRWTPAEGKVDAFVDAWAEFARWASGMPGAGTLRMTRDVRNPSMFLSLGAWESVDAVRAWKQSAEFKERLARVLQHVDEFEPSELAVIATATAGGAARTSAPAAEPVHAAR